MSADFKIMEHIKSVLEQFGAKYIDNNNLKRYQVVEDLDNYDKELMQALLSDELIHNTYTEKVLDTEIFKLNQFIEMLEYKEFWQDSYTKYQNKIGLSNGGKFIDDSDDIVLDFPYKDTVLKAGMTKEDSDEKETELFLNQVLAGVEIDELEDPKILINAKRFDKDGEHTISDFSDLDNLILKGNNLNALYSIRSRYAGKIKLIYLDPPYNTGSDSFKYNDSFSRSAWLTFIHNRIQIARELLSEDGVLLIQTSFHQYPYLRVLLDGENNIHHIFDMNVLVRHPDRALTADKTFNDVMEYTLIYSKNSNFQMPKKIEKKTSEKYTYTVNTKGNPDEILRLGNKEVEVYLPEHTVIKKQNPSVTNLHRETIRGTLREKNSSGRFYVAYIEPLRKKYPNRTIFKVPKMGDDNLGFRYFELPKSDKTKNGAYYQGMPMSTDVTKKPYANFIDMKAEYNHVSDQGKVSFRNGKKPEELIKYYLDIFTKEGDMILDFFMGSATTQAVAMKMNRSFIGVEQMDYINTVSVPRLQKVIDGEQGGISKKVNWQDGGSFVYAELMEKGQTFINQIQNAKSDKDLNVIFQKMKTTDDINFKVDLEKFEATRDELSFTEQQKILCEMIDKNQLYYNERNIDDKDIREQITESDYRFNKIFYREEG